MRNSRGNSAVVPLGSASPTWLWTERRSLAIAVLLSLALHVLLLVSWRAQREGAPLQPALVVRLTGAFIAPRRPQVVQPPLMPPAPPRVATAASHREAVASAATPERPAASVASAATHERPAASVASAATPESPSAPVASAATPERVPASAVASSESSSESASEPVPTDDVAFYRSDQLSQGPVPTTQPAADRVAAAHLMSRRLVVTVFVDEGGAVRKAIVAPYEISPQQAQVLQEAVAAVHFTPANIEGKPVAAQVQSRLCFDDSGLLDTSSPGCWQFNPQPAH